MFALVVALLMGAPPGPTVHMDPARGVPRAIFGLDEATTGRTPAARALGFAERRADLLGVDTRGLRVSRVSPVRGGHVVSLQAHLGGLPVEGRFLSVRLDDEGRVRRVHSDLDRWTLPDEPVRLTAGEARTVATGHVEAATAGEARQVALPLGPGLIRVAWRVPVAKVPLLLHYIVYVDAANGRVLRADPGSLDQPRETAR